MLLRNGNMCYFHRLVLHMHALKSMSTIDVLDMMVAHE